MSVKHQSVLWSGHECVPALASWTSFCITDFLGLVLDCWSSFSAFSSIWYHWSPNFQIRVGWQMCRRAKVRPPQLLEGSIAKCSCWTLFRLSCTLLWLPFSCSAKKLLPRSKQPAELSEWKYIKIYDKLGNGWHCTWISHPHISHIGSNIPLLSS